MNNETLETVAEPVSMPLAVMKDGTQIMDKAATPQQMRVMEVNEALAPAYQRASTLEMTEKEIEAIMAPFPDSVVEVRPHDGLIYIPHIHVSDRLNRVFNPGKWSLVCRRHWLEGTTMYGEYILLIRGCYVGESVGGHPYQPNNPKVNYSDTLESTAAEALRRIAGKRLSCGWQVWDPSYANMWCEKYRGQQNGKFFKKSASAPAARPPAASARPPAAKPAAPAVILLPTDKTREWFIAEVVKSGYPFEQMQQFCIDLAWLMPNEPLEKLELRFVANTPEKLKMFKNCIENWSAKGDTCPPYDAPIPDPKAKPVEVPREAVGNPGDEDAWRQFPMPFGKHAGTPMEDLEKNYLFGLWANYKVETEYNGRPKKPETIAKDTTFREMLDLAGTHYEFKKKD